MDERSSLAVVAGGATLGLAALWLHRRRRAPRRSALRTRRLAPDLEVTVLGCGGASLGDLYVETTHECALATLRAALDAGIQFFDTAPWYGCGLSEARFGLGLLRTPRSRFALNTKVGRFLVPDPRARNATPAWAHGSHFTVKFDYSGPALRRQWEDSLQRTGLGRVDSLVIHDLEPGAHASDDDPTGVAATQAHLDALGATGFAELCALRESGAIKAFVAGVNADENGEDAQAKDDWNRKYVDALFAMGDAHARGIDFLLIANCYSLLNFTAHDLGILDDCAARGVSVVIGGPFSSGILATGPDPKGGGVAYYNYRPADAAIRDRARKIQAACGRHGVPLVAAALQFPLGHPAVASVIPGGKNPAEVRSNVDAMNHPIPARLWADLKDEGLIPRDARTPPC